jgi:hypothetical protein
MEKENPEKTVNRIQANLGIVNSGYTWRELWTIKLNYVKDIKFAPKFFGLAFGAACTSGEVIFYTTAT